MTKKKKKTIVADLKQMGFLTEGRRRKKKKQVKPVILVWRVLSSVKGRKSHAKRNV